MRYGIKPFTESKQEEGNVLVQTTLCVQNGSWSKRAVPFEKMV